MSETRTITVKGDASIFKVGADSSPGAKTTRRRARAIPTATPVFVKMDAGGSATSAAAVAGGGSATPPKSADPPAPASAPAQAGADRLPAATPAKVVLGGKKPKAMKVLLTKKNHGPADAPPTSNTAAKKHRKVTLGIQHLKRRVTKARRLNKMTKTLSIDQIRKELIAGKMIKEDSKAPEPILRQMYADAKLITTKSL